MKSVFLYRVVILAFVALVALAGASTAFGQLAKESSNVGAMIMEHVGLGCTNCHGSDGPKGMMMEHQDMECSVCHTGASTAVKAGAKELAGSGVPLDDAMILEHKNMGCGSCHGKKGPKGMMMEHEGISCAVCHPTKH